MSYDFSIYHKNRARLIELEIRRLVYERGDMTPEQYAVWKENQWRAEQLKRREATTL